MRKSQSSCCHGMIPATISKLSRRYALKSNAAQTEVITYILQVERLAAVFRDMYNFEIRQEKLNHNERAQAQMNEHLATFVRKYEKESNKTLMIIYYAGHGWSDGAPRKSKRNLRLAAYDSTTLTKIQQLMLLPVTPLRKRKSN